jgi:hypothetical protein
MGFGKYSEGRGDMEWGDWVREKENKEEPKVCGLNKWIKWQQQSLRW